LISWCASNRGQTFVYLKVEWLFRCFIYGEEFKNNPYEFVWSIVLFGEMIFGWNVFYVVVMEAVRLIGTMD
jgi:hypothetical protein